MNRSRNQNALLMEIMIAVLFFALCASVILETFVTAREYSRDAGIYDVVLIEMQNLAEQFSLADVPADVLNAEGFVNEDGLWLYDGGDYCLEVELGREDAPAGRIETALIRAQRREKTIAEMPWARYFPGEDAP